MFPSQMQLDLTGLPQATAGDHDQTARQAAPVLKSTPRPHALPARLTAAAGLDGMQGRTHQGSGEAVQALPGTSKAVLPTSPPGHRYHPLSCCQPKLAGRQAPPPADTFSSQLLPQQAPNLLGAATPPQVGIGPNRPDKSVPQRLMHHTLKFPDRNRVVYGKSVG